MTVPSIPHRCIDPRCRCESRAATCSLWCGSPEASAGGRCLCRHDECAGRGGRPPMAPPPVALFPTVFDRFRPEQRGFG